MKRLLILTAIVILTAPTLGCHRHLGWWRRGAACCAPACGPTCGPQGYIGGEVIVPPTVVPSPAIITPVPN